MLLYNTCYVIKYKTYNVSSKTDDMLYNKTDDMLCYITHDMYVI